MKKVTIALIPTIAFLVHSTHAQTDKGTVMVGASTWGRTEIYAGKIEEVFFSFRPNFGKFVADDLALGFEIPLSFQHYSTVNVYGYGFTPNIRYYFAHAGPFGFFGSALAGYSSHRDVDVEHTTTYHHLAAGFGGGSTWFINEGIGLEGVAGYEHTLYGNDDHSNLRLRLGFQLFF